MIPTGEYFWISSIFELQGRTAENTFCSRTRRAISCEYCAPKSRTTIDWVSTDEVLRSLSPCKDQVAGSGRHSKSVHQDQRQLTRWVARLEVARQAPARLFPHLRAP